MRLEHHLVGGYVRYISPYIIIIIKLHATSKMNKICRAAPDAMTQNDRQQTIFSLFIHSKQCINYVQVYNFPLLSV